MAPGFDKRHPRQIDHLPTKFFQRGALGAEAAEFDIQEFESSQTAQRKEKSEKALLELVRDLQNFLRALVQAIEAFESFVHGVGSFRNEEKSSALYLLLVGGLITLVYAASFVPAQIAIGVLIWVGALLCHPKLRRKANKANKKYISPKASLFPTDWFDNFTHSEIVVDEEPESRLVEIFELEKQGLTPRLWTPWVYSPVVYELHSSLRVSMSRPPGVRFLSDVKPPEGWFFVEGSENPEDEWAVDRKTKGWVSHRAIRSVELDLDDAWAYDYSGEQRGEWRRRRWIRRCYRYVAT